MSGRRTNEGPGKFLIRTPGLQRFGADKGAFAGPLCPRGTALSSTAWRRRAQQRTDLSALSMWPLPRSGAALSTLRSRQSVLRRSVCRCASAGVAAPRRSPLSKQPPGRPSACRSPRRLARPPTTKSDASRFPARHLRCHSRAHLNRSHITARPCPTSCPIAPCSRRPGPRGLALQFLPLCTATLRTLVALA